jgi:hypothetical protein
MHDRRLSRGHARAWSGPRGPAPHAGCRRTVALEREGPEGRVMLLRHVIFRSPIFRLLHHARVRIGDVAMKGTCIVNPRPSMSPLACRAVSSHEFRRELHLMDLTWPLAAGAHRGHGSRTSPGRADRRRTPRCARFVPRPSAALYVWNREVRASGRSPTKVSVWLADDKVVHGADRRGRARP